MVRSQEGLHNKKNRAGMKEKKGSKKGERRRKKERKEKRREFRWIYRRRRSLKVKEFFFSISSGKRSRNKI